MPQAMPSSVVFRWGTVLVVVLRLLGLEDDEVGPFELFLGPLVGFLQLAGGLFEELQHVLTAFAEVQDEGESQLALGRQDREGHLPLGAAPAAP